jgi:hypothetical protein
LALFLLVAAISIPSVEGAVSEVRFQYVKPEFYTKCAPDAETIVLTLNGVYLWGSQKGSYQYDPQKSVFIFNNGPLASMRATLIDKGTGLMLPFPRGRDVCIAKFARVRTWCPIYPFC